MVPGRTAAQLLMPLQRQLLLSMLLSPAACHLGHHQAYLQDPAQKQMSWQGLSSRVKALSVTSPHCASSALLLSTIECTRHAYACKATVKPQSKTTPPQTFYVTDLLCHKGQLQ